jgi:hypothetical protein
MNAQEVLRCYQLLEDTDAPPLKLLAGFLVPSADPQTRRVALRLCSKLRARDDEVVAALLRVLRARDEPWATELVCSAVETLLLLFGGAESAERLARLLRDTRCLPRCERGATAADIFFLSALFQLEIAAFLALEVEAVLSEALWSPELANAALVLARAVCHSGGEDVPAAVELLFRALRHNDARIACTSRALLWETVAHRRLRNPEERELLLSRLVGPAAASASSPAGQTADLAGMMCTLLATPETPRHQLLITLLSRPPPANQQSRALLQAFLPHHLTVERAGSALLFLVCAGNDPALSITALTGPRPLGCSPDARRAAKLLFDVVARAEAVAELSEAILEHAAPDDRAFLTADDVAQALQTAFGSD